MSRVNWRVAAPHSAVMRHLGARGLPRGAQCAGTACKARVTALLELFVSPRTIRETQPGTWCSSNLTGRTLNDEWKLNEPHYWKIVVDELNSNTGNVAWVTACTTNLASYLLVRMPSSGQFVVCDELNQFTKLREATHTQDNYLLFRWKSWNSIHDWHRPRVQF